MRTLLAIVADPHTGSRAGLCPPEVELETTAEGSPAVYKASTVQLAIWDAWCGFWQTMSNLSALIDARLVGVLAGDGADDNKYSKAVLISANKNDISRAVDGALDPMVSVCDEWYMVRGTQAHSGECAVFEEGAARRNGAVPNEEAKTASWWFLPLCVEGMRLHIAHHPFTAGYLPWTEGSAVKRVSAGLRAWYLESFNYIPDMAVFGHVHYADDSGADMRKPRVLFCPGWQATTSFGIRKGKAGIVRPIGGWWMVCENGEYTEPKLERYNWRKEIKWQNTNSS